MKLKVTAKRTKNKFLIWIQGTKLEIDYQMSITVGFHTFFHLTFLISLKINKNIQKKKQLSVFCFKVVFFIRKIFFIQ